MDFNINFQVDPFKFMLYLGITIRLKGLLIFRHSNAFKILHIVGQN